MRHPASPEEFSEATDYDVATINAFLGCQSQELIRLSLLGGNANKGANAFQFHMVRLKGIQFFLVFIPIIFQFHMVRLKVSAINEVRASVEAFQFHMVRLKA